MSCIGTSLIVVNQLRQNPNVMYGNPEYTPGGTALKFFSSVRVNIRRLAKSKGGIIKSIADNIVGIKSHVKTEKNKTYLPFQECDIEFNLVPKDEIDDLIEICVKSEIVNKNKRNNYIYKSNENLGDIKSTSYDGFKDVLSDPKNVNIVEEMKNRLKATSIDE